MEYRVPETLTADDVKNLVFRLTHPRSANPTRCLTRAVAKRGGCPSPARKYGEDLVTGDKPAVEKTEDDAEDSEQIPDREKLHMKKQHVDAVTARLLRPTTSSCLRESFSPGVWRRSTQGQPIAGFLCNNYGHKDISEHFGNGYYHFHRVVEDTHSVYNCKCVSRQSSRSDGSSSTGTSRSRANSSVGGRSQFLWSAQTSRIVRPTSRSRFETHNTGSFPLDSAADRHPSLLFITNSQIRDYRSHTIASKTKKKPSAILSSELHSNRTVN